MNYLRNITFLFEAAPFIFCLIYLKKLNSKNLRIFFVYSFSIFLLILISNYFFYFKKDHPQYYFNTLWVFVIIEFALVSTFLQYTLKNKMIKKMILFFIIPFVIYAIFDFFTYTKSQFDFTVPLIECLFFLIYIVYYFYEQLKFVSSTPMYFTAQFWLVIGFFIFCSGNFFQFLFKITSVQNDLFKHQYALIYSTFTILKNCCLCLGIYFVNWDENKLNMIKEK